MTGYAFTLRGAGLIALPSGALWWPAAGVLALSDLHLGKADRVARRGGTLLPPYENADTLARLDADIAATGAATVVCVGDSFDDGAAELSEADALWLTRLMAGRTWIWIAGNHDPVPVATGGTCLGEWGHGPLVFRHIAAPGTKGEVSGHYHPKARLAGQSRRCFLLDDARVILPAYGTYTGGLACDHPALRALMGAGALAVLTGPVCLPLPYDRLGG